MPQEQRLENAIDPAEKAEHCLGDHNSKVNLNAPSEEIAVDSAVGLQRNARRAPTLEDLCRLACHIYEARRVRDCILGSKFFGEPAWDMLLALYHLPAKGEVLTVSGLSIAANCAHTTGIRYQSTLEKMGLIERGPHGMDARKRSVRLTDKGRIRLETVLTRFYYLDVRSPMYPEKAGG